MTTLDSARAQPGWRFWFLWMLASLGGAVVYMVVVPPILNALVLSSPGGPAWEMSMIENFAGPISLGAAIGLAQWLVLRQVLSRVGWWVPATLFGYSAVTLAPWIVNGIDAGPLSGFLMMLIIGAVLGLAQWLVLRVHFQHAGWWVALIMAAWALAWGVTGLAEISGLYVEPFDLLSVFLVPNAVAGGGIIWLVRRTGSPTLNSGGAKIQDRGLS